MRIFLVRHGETVDNDAGLISGSRNPELSERGIEQALALAQRLKGESFSKVFSSDLQRALRTCKLISPKSQIEATALIRERNFGEFEGRPKSELMSAIAAFGSEPQDFEPKDGESFSAIEKRLNAFWTEKLLSQTGRVLICAHGSLNRTLLRLLLGLSYSEQFELQQSNCCLNLLEGEALGSFKAKFLNCSSHLPS